MAPRRTEKSQTLLALTSGALLLPAYQGAQADAPPEFTELGLRYSKYQEDDTKERDTFGGASERYSIDVAQFHLLAPVADDWSVMLDVQWEDMSGASPWFVGESLEGGPKVVMSGASIADTRTDVSVTTRYYYDRGSVGLNLAHSDEDDYQSDAIGLDGAFNSADGLRTYSASISASDDDIEPTQGSVPTNTLNDEKDTRSAWVGVSQIVSQRALLRFGLGYTYREGFLTDPYKYRDRRPDERKEWVASAGYRYYLAGSDSALHADYRYFNDDWGIRSHTVDLSWHSRVGEGTRLIPFVRYYSQSEADFFANAIDQDRSYHSSDYRLSAFGALSGGLRIRQDIDRWSVSGTVERYQADGSWGLYSGEESPALVAYWRFSAGLDYRFE